MSGSAIIVAEAIEVPPGLRFAKNHMWLGASLDGAHRLGLDAFAARVLGRVDRVRFAAPTDARRPAVIISAAGVDLRMNALRGFAAVEANTTLENHPELLVEDPYGDGWLFTHASLADGGGMERFVREDLLDGERAANWMAREVSRLSCFVAELPLATGGERLAADGGVFVPGVVELLHPEDRLFLFDTFFGRHRVGFARPCGEDLPA